MATTFTLEIENNDYGCPTLGPINYTNSSMSDGSSETDLVLQKLVSDGYLDLDDFRKLCSSLEVES